MLTGKCPRCGAPERGPHSELPHSTACERCGEPVCQPTGSGRRRRWCSDACRRRGWEERQAAQRGAIAVRQIPVQPSLSECVERVADSPAAARHLFKALRVRAEQGRCVAAPGTRPYGRSTSWWLRSIRTETSRPRRECEARGQRGERDERDEWGPVFRKGKGRTGPRSVRQRPVSRVDLAASPGQPLTASTRHRNRTL